MHVTHLLPRHSWAPSFVLPSKRNTQSYSTHTIRNCKR